MYMYVMTSSAAMVASAYFFRCTSVLPQKQHMHSKTDVTVTGL